MPKVSIIIPTYNHPLLLQRALNSVLAQTYNDYEAIIIDDGSTDDIPSIGKSFARQDTRFKYFRQENSGCVAGATNSGLKRASGEYIAILHSDDEWLPTKLERQVLFLDDGRRKNPRLGFVGSNATFVYADGHEENKPIEKPQNLVEALLIKNFILPSGTIFTREAVTEIGFWDEATRILDDRDAWLRMAQKFDFDIVPETLYRYHIHGFNTSIGVDRTKLAEELEWFMNKFQTLYAHYPNALHHEWGTIGSYFIRGGQTKRGRAYLKKLLSARPTLGNLLHLTASYLGRSAYITYRNLRGRI